VDLIGAKAPNVRYEGAAVCPSGCFATEPFTLHLCWKFWPSSFLAAMPTTPPRQPLALARQTAPLLPRPLGGSSNQQPARPFLDQLGRGPGGVSHSQAPLFPAFTAFIMLPPNSHPKHNFPLSAAAAPPYNTA
jgi:hypothetical protein